MRLLLAVAAMLFLVQCASKDEPEETRFVVGQSQKAYVFIGAAEASDSTTAGYTMLWRRLDPATGRFAEFDGRNTFTVQTNSDSSLRVSGIPGEFTSGQIEPGVWALDNIYAIIRDRRVNYYANGVVIGPDRPSFEVRAGEAIYLGVWELRISETNAVGRPWRLDAADLQAVVRDANETVGNVEARAAVTRAVPCDPHRLNAMSQRQVC